MSHAMMALLAAGGATTPKIYSDDVFSSFLYTGNGSTQAIAAGIDFAAKGGLIWIKQRDVGNQHLVLTSANGITTGSKVLDTSTSATFSDGSYGSSRIITSLDSSGITLGSGSSFAASNVSSSSYVAWLIRNAPKFFYHQQIVKSSGSNATVDLTSLGTVGMVKVKRIDASGSWYIWHRSNTSGKLMIGETTAAEATLGHITVSGTTLTLVNGVIADGTYHVEAYAHNTTSDGLIQCGSFTDTAGVEVNLGWEAQYILVKSSSASSPWAVYDTSRGNSYTQAQELQPDSSSGEGAVGTGYLIPTATGFKLGISGTGTNTTRIFMAIRRPNKPPTLGTQVYNAIARTGTSAPANVTGLGFNPDLMFSTDKNNVNPNNSTLVDRLRGGTCNLLMSSTQAENSYGAVTSFNPDGYSLNSDGVLLSSNTSGRTYIQQCFKRAPGFFDVVCWQGTKSGSGNELVSHNLGVVPELVIYKARSTTSTWYTVTGFNSTQCSQSSQGLNNTNARSLSAYANNDVIAAQPTTTQIQFGYPYSPSGQTNVAYLFATLVGISKVFSYTGNGTSQTIACGFAAGARFILIKRTDSTGDWFIWDTVRGIVAGNDPHLSLNTTAAEVTTDDSIDPDSSGFIVNQLSATNINVTSATYIGLAIA